MLSPILHVSGKVREKERQGCTGQKENSVLPASVLLPWTEAAMGSKLVARVKDHIPTS